MSNFVIYNDTLCPDLWDEYSHLEPRTRLNLLRMAYDFYQKTKLPAPIIDIYLMGSIANFNWTPDSDADVHVIIDYNQLQMPLETAIKTVKIAGAMWNEEHQVFLKGHKVEMNIQNVREVKPHVTGIYTVIKDNWVRKPSKQNVQVDKSAIQTMYKGMKTYIDSALNSNSREIMKSAKEYLDAFRQYGLDTHGELSYENIVFKILRSKGLIKKLKDSITLTYDREMSVDEKMENTLPPDKNAPYIVVGYVDKKTGKIISGVTYTGVEGHGNLPDITSPISMWFRYKSKNRTLYVDVPTKYDKHNVERFLFDIGMIKQHLSQKYNINNVSRVTDNQDEYLEYGHRIDEVGMVETKINEMPQMSLKGKQAMAGDAPLKGMDVENVRGNVVFMRNDKPGFMVEGFSLVYFMDSEESAQAMKEGKLPYLMIPRGTFHSGGSPITDVWKKKFQRPGTEHILGLIEANTSPEMIYIDMISVRPGWQRNHVAKLMIDILKRQFPQAKMETSSRTDKGEKLYKGLQKKEEPITENDVYNAVEDFQERRSSEFTEGYGMGDPTKDPKAVGRWTVKY